jgi:histidinol-phosphate aminotransferase
MLVRRRHLLAQFAGAMASGRLSRILVGGDLSGHTPVENPGKQLLRLDRNENAYGTSQKAIEAIERTASESSLYPGNVEELTRALASHHGVRPERVLVGCGATELLSMSTAAFLSAGDKLIVATPTHDVSAKCAAARVANIVRIPLRRDYSHDLGAMLAQTKDAAGLIYICNPNNPTGTLTEHKEIESFLHDVPPSFHVVIDEAYHHYAGNSEAYASLLDRPVSLSRVVVVRTFSKVYGLAGLRVGYAVAGEEAITRMAARALPFGVNRLGLTAALAALRDEQQVKRCARQNANDRQEFMNQVNGRMLRALDSHTNFVCLNTTEPAGPIIEHFRRNDILLPPVIAELPTYIRVSLGKPEQMDEFWRIWDVLNIHPMKM